MRVRPKGRHAGERRRSRKTRVVPEPAGEPVDNTGPGHSEEPRFCFGQYRGERFSTITEDESHYYMNFAKKEKWLGKCLQDYFDWVEKHYIIQDKVLARKNDTSISSVRADTPPKAVGKKTIRKSTLQTARESGA